MLELENGLLTFMEMFIKDKVDLLKVTLDSIMSVQYLQSLVHLFGFRFLIFFFNFHFCGYYGRKFHVIICHSLMFLI